MLIALFIYLNGNNLFKMEILLLTAIVFQASIQPYDTYSSKFNAPLNTVSVVRCSLARTGPHAIAIDVIRTHLLYQRDSSSQMMAINFKKILLCLLL